MSEPLVLAIDQGSSATKSLALGQRGEVVGQARVPVREFHPRPGWVEQDAEEIRRSVQQAVRDCLDGLDGAAVAAIGVANQRESLLLWERSTGRPLGPLVSWQDLRTAELCRELDAGSLGREVMAVSGLPLDPMFSAPKARWLLDQHDPDRDRSAAGGLCLGTVDSWLLSQGGDHVIEIGNAARTQLLDLDTGDWSPGLLRRFGIPAAALPRIVPSGGPFPPSAGLDPVPDGTPVRAVLGDSHAALFGHGVRQPGVIKATYGTGSSVMGLAGRGQPPGGICRTIAWQLTGAQPSYALEGNIRASGATLAWLARVLGTTSDDLAGQAAGAASEGVHIVPAFSGLGAPWWDRQATGLITGLSLGTTLPSLARAALESISFQVTDVVTAMTAGRPAGDGYLLADGGASVSDALMQSQADLAGIAVHRSRAPGVSALGAAHLAGLEAGVWDQAFLADQAERRDVFLPGSTAAWRQERIRAWHDAVRRARGDSTFAQAADQQGSTEP